MLDKYLDCNIFEFNSTYTREVILFEVIIFLIFVLGWNSPQLPFWICRRLHVLGVWDYTLKSFFMQFSNMRKSWHMSFWTSQIFYSQGWYMDLWKFSFLLASFTDADWCAITCVFLFTFSPTVLFVFTSVYCKGINSNLLLKAHSNIDRSLQVDLETLLNLEI
jgi:hypothetical protein